MDALLIGRFHAVTKAQDAWLQSLRGAPVERLICVVTSANHAGTRRNPLDVETRAKLLRPALARTGKPFELVEVDDVPDHWVEHVVTQVGKRIGRAPTPVDTSIYGANRDVDRLWSEAGFTVVAQPVKGLTPHELVMRIAAGSAWEDDASPETRALYSQPKVRATLQHIFSQTLVNDDGELGHKRDFLSYGTQMDASLQQKLDDLLKWVKPGLIVDKGCGTGKLLVELAKVFPKSGFVGVDLSREFLRMSDENHYEAEDVSLQFGNIIEQNVPAGTASTIVFSSVTHEIYSYSDYSLAALDKAFANAALELQPGGHVLVRDGVSPGQMPWRMKLRSPEVIATFERFAREFKHGQGAAHERLGSDEVRISAHLANEFICKKDYLKNWHIEVHEEYGAHTLEGYAAALEKAGLEAVSVTGYVNPWIARHRYEGTVELRDEATGREVPWPDTNAIVVGRKA
ncbi:MAG: methyltransferase [Myxococcaceae bacterium]|nr:methyltransferase [Myxococcaceae bacterium]